MLAKVENGQNKALRLACVGETDYERVLTTYNENKWSKEEETDSESEDGFFAGPYMTASTIPLNAILEWKDEVAAETLLDGGDNPNKLDNKGYNALHVAAWNGCRLPLFNRILERIKNVNAITRMNSGCRTNGCTALMFAATNNHLDMVTALMQHPKIDLNVQNHENETALHWAVDANSPAILAQLLSDSRIDTSLKDITAETPLKKAIRWKRAECVKILREHGVRAKARIIAEERLFHFQIISDHPLIKKAKQMGYTQEELLSKKLLRKKWKEMLLESHPDKTLGNDTTKQSQDINGLYTDLKKFFEDTDTGIWTLFEI